MFKQLVESGSHRADFARRGTFFIGTLALYAVLLVVAGVASVFAYDAHLDQQNLEVTLLTAVPPSEPPTRAQPEHAAAPQPHAGNSRDLPMRVALVADIRTPIMPTAVSNQPSPIPPMPPGPIALGPVNYDPPGGFNRAGASNNSSPGNSGVRVSISDTDDVAPPTPTPAPTPKPVPALVRLTSSLITSKVISKPVPAYPIIAKQAHAFGPVTVEILVDEQGRVISAQATSGHPLLREAARQAALHARFSPTLLSGQPVKVSGVITYNFVLQ